MNESKMLIFVYNSDRRVYFITAIVSSLQEYKNIYTLHLKLGVHFIQILLHEINFI